MHICRSSFTLMDDGIGVQGTLKIIYHMYKSGFPCVWISYDSCDQGTPVTQNPIPEISKAIFSLLPCFLQI